MKVSVIIPTYHRLKDLEICLKALSPENQNVNKEDYEIIVTDDGKDIISKNLTDQYNYVTWVKGPGRGPAANRNNGASQATSDWIIFTDDDCIPQKGWLSAYLGFLKDNPAIKVFEGQTIPDREQRRFDEECPANLHGGLLWSCNFMIRKDFFFSLGGFDETFPFAAMEDVDFRIRIEALKEEILFCPTALIIHPWVIRNKLTHVKNHFRSTLLFIRKHPAYKSEINSVYYLRWIFRDFTKNFLKNLIRYKFHGAGFKIRNYFLHLKFSAFLLFNRPSKNGY